MLNTRNNSVHWESYSLNKISPPDTFFHFPVFIYGLQKLLPFQSRNWQADVSQNNLLIWDFTCKTETDNNECKNQSSMYPIPMQILQQINHIF